MVIFHSYVSHNQRVTLFLTMDHGDFSERWHRPRSVGGPDSIHVNAPTGREAGVFRTGYRMVPLSSVNVGL